eukprot:GCRY01001913.1.p1 GENE.GCRY01001913.1~~GCRY01001913.1.p1  ORF type:complete len:366 (-),score=68.68 GCRY01001913.1:228-1325(-)
MRDGFLIGVMFAICGHGSVGLGQTIQKFAFNKLQDTNDNTVYVKSPWWLFGQCIMFLGEGLNFISLSLIPVSVAAPLAASGIVVNALAARKHLHEKITMKNVIGLIGVIFGATLVIGFGQQQEKDMDVDQFSSMLSGMTFIVFISFVIVVLSCGIFTDMVLKVKNLFVFVLVSAMFSVFTLLSSKGLSTFMKLTAEGENQFGSPIPFLCVFVIGGCGVMSIIYNNKAMAVFDSSLVVPVLYGHYSTMSVTTGIVVNDEASSLSGLAIFMFLVGVVTMIAGVAGVLNSRSFDATNVAGRHPSVPHTRLEEVLEGSFSEDLTEEHEEESVLSPLESSAESKLTITESDSSSRPFDLSNSHTVSVSLD